MYYIIIILSDHRRICDPSLTETSLCGAYLYVLVRCKTPWGWSEEDRSMSGVLVYDVWKCIFNTRALVGVSLKLFSNAWIWMLFKTQGISCHAREKPNQCLIVTPLLGFWERNEYRMDRYMGWGRNVGRVGNEINEGRERRKWKWVRSWTAK
jgi:hypothetical protein